MYVYMCGLCLKPWPDIYTKTIRLKPSGPHTNKKNKAKSCGGGIGLANRKGGCFSYATELNPCFANITSESVHLTVWKFYNSRNWLNGNALRTHGGHTGKIFTFHDPIYYMFHMRIKELYAIFLLLPLLLFTIFLYFFLFRFQMAQHFRPIAIAVADALATGMWLWTNIVHCVSASVWDCVYLLLHLFSDYILNLYISDEKYIWLDYDGKVG